MQNKGAIRLLAILLALACAYYLMFTYVGVGIENDAKKYAEEYVARPDVTDAAKKVSSSEVKQQTYIDSLKNAKANFYLDSLKKLPVIDVYIAKYTYDEVRNQQLNLGLDLKGGMNVTLEVSVEELIRGLSNNSNDPAFNEALKNATALLVKSSKDYVTLFGEEYHKINPNGHLAINFQTIELKGKIDFNSTDDEVLAFLRSRVDEAIETSEKTLRTRIDKFGVTQPNIKRLSGSGRILIELPGVTDKARVRKLLVGTANLEFWETYNNADQKDGIAEALNKANTRLKEILSPELVKADSAKKADSTSTTGAIAKTASDSSKTKTTVADSAKKGGLDAQLGDNIKDDTTKGADGLTTAQRASVDSAKRENPLFALLQPAYKYNEKNEFQGLGEGPIVGSAFIKDTAKIGQYLRNPKIRSIFRPYTRFAWYFKPYDPEEKRLQLFALNGATNKGKAPLSGDIITEAEVVFDQSTGGNPSIRMSMTTEAGNAWKRLTRANVGKSVAIVLDGSVYSFPNVNEEIGGGVSTITGQFSQAEATDLVTILKAGKLPAKTVIVQEAVVGPTLGAEAIHKGFVSTIIALLLVLLFMGFYYSKAGWVADLAMIINNFFVVGILASFGAVLTLPGIAGIVLTIAMSVDANILIFERVREELLLGKAVGVSIKEGYRNAMSSVIDSHITGLLLGIILYVFGTGPIQGFATTLIIGIISSLFCAIFITRLIFDRWLKKGVAIPFGNKMTEKAFRSFNFNFVGKRKWYYVFSLLIITAGVISFLNKGFSLGVDFKGGRSYVVRFDDPKPTDEVIKALTTTFGEAPEVKLYGEGGTQVNITTTYKIEDQGDNVESQVEDKLNEGLAKLNEKYEIMSSVKVGETVSRDIKTKAIWAVLLSCLVMFMFIFIRFKKWQYGLGAVVALFHDVLIVLSVYTIFDGILPFSLEITQDFIAAILTVMSYSMVDSVVVFDRIREYLTERNKADLDKTERVKVINYALNSTLSRTINTALTIFFVMLAIFLFGGETIKGFAFALLIGIAIGTYSSICIATPIVIDLEREKPEAEKK
ncbi:MAG: protein translocase subunit SecDF [Bacteroidia bacterium]